jgi:hypothetical protein
MRATLITGVLNFNEIRVADKVADKFRFQCRPVRGLECRIYLSPSQSAKDADFFTSSLKTLTENIFPQSPQNKLQTNFLHISCHCSHWLAVKIFSTAHLVFLVICYPLSVIF